MKILISLVILMSWLFSDIKVYVSHNSKIDSISVHDLKNLYLKKIKYLNNQKVIIYDNTEDYSSFNKIFLKKTDTQIHAYWMKQIFSGNRIPPQKVISSEIITILNKDPLAISYSKENLDLKVIYESK